MKLFIIVFYTILIIVMIIPLFIFDAFGVRILFFHSVRQYLNFSWNSFIFLGLGIFTLCVLFFDLFFFNEKERVRKNIAMIRHIIGKDKRMFPVVALLSGFSEELLFRGYGFVAISVINNNNLMSVTMIGIFVIALIFGVLHVNQGKKAFIISIIVSIVFFISVIISKTIWYAVFFHVLFNYIELSIITRLQIKKEL